MGENCSGLTSGFGKKECASGDSGEEGEGSLPGLVTADERFSAVRSFLETEVLNLKRLDPNNLERKLPSWSFCFDFFCTSSLTVSWTLLVFTEALLYP